MVVQIIHGSRSEKYAAKDWFCHCGTLNKVKSFLIFELPPFFCGNVGCKSVYLGIVYFNLADVEVNGKTILPELKDQGSKPECISYAFAHAQELNDNVENIILNDDSPIEDIDPMMLTQRYNMMFRPEMNPEWYNSKHKILYTGLLLKEYSRTKAKDKFRSTHSNVVAVNSSKWEYICQCIADGHGVVGTFAAGKRLHQLKFGQVYSPPKNKCASGHAVVFVGAVFYQLKIIYIFLNSWQEEFCAFRDEDGKIIVGGIGMVDGVELLCNPVVLSRSWEEVVNGLSGSWRLYSSSNEAMSDVECMVNPEKLMPTFVDKKFDVCASYDIINKKFDISKEDSVIQDEDVLKKAIEGNAEEVQLAADMLSFSRPERLVNGPMPTHSWSTLKLLDVLLQFDLKNAKASIPNDFFMVQEVNESSHFCGVAEMVGPVDYQKDMDFWCMDKWTGSFPVKWHIIKNVHNFTFRSILLQNNEDKPVTSSRDTQEIHFTPGTTMLELFKYTRADGCVLDGFMMHEEEEARSRQLQRFKLRRSAPHFIPAWRGPRPYRHVLRESDSVVMEKNASETNKMSDKLQNLNLDRRQASWQAFENLTSEASTTNRQKESYSYGTHAHGDIVNATPSPTRAYHSITPNQISALDGERRRWKKVEIVPTEKPQPETEKSDSVVMDKITSETNNLTDKVHNLNLERHQASWQDFWNQTGKASTTNRQKEAHVSIVKAKPRPTQAYHPMTPNQKSALDGEQRCWTKVEISPTVKPQPETVAIISSKVPPGEHQQGGKKTLAHSASGAAQMTSGEQKIVGKSCSPPIVSTSKACSSPLPCVVAIGSILIPITMSN